METDCTLEDLIHIHATLREGILFLRRRDQMNAALHQDDVRFSPLTLRLQHTQGLLTELIDAAQGKPDVL